MNIFSFNITTGATKTQRYTTIVLYFREESYVKMRKHLKIKPKEIAKRTKPFPASWKFLKDTI